MFEVGIGKPAYAASFTDLAVKGVFEYARLVSQGYYFCIAIISPVDFQCTYARYRTLSIEKFRR